LTRSALTLALCSLVALGCGGDDAAKEEPERAVTVPANARVAVVGREYSFDPSRVVVRGAGPLTLILRNRGSLAHNLKVVRNREQIGGTPSFPAGQARSARVNLEHGNYQIVCTVGDHAELGMRGTLRVR
jgi:plastocyanin